MGNKKFYQSMDIAKEKREQLKELFPEVFNEDTVDFDQLKRVLGEWVEPGKERFGLTWAGKADCMKVIQQQSVASLKPARDESVNFDDTENLFIEGDNLEVLKLLQKSYFGKVKLIYIDPPYNTGNEFIYPDKYNETLETYLAYTGQIDNAGHKFATNTDTSGRYHSRWLSMMYPRLYLAKNLLREDGVLVVQIDDNEFCNLKNHLDELFGEENLVSTICVKMSHLSGMKMSHKAKKFPKIKEFILIYARNKDEFSMNEISIPADWDEVFDRYNSFIEKQGGNCEQWVVHNLNKYIKSKNINEKQINEFKLKNADSIFRTAVNDSFAKLPKNSFFEKVITKTGLEKFSYKGEEVLFASSKLVEIEGNKVPTLGLGDIWTDIGINNLHNEGDVKFENGKKPLKLIRRILSAFTDSDEEHIVLDFFAGSGTTGHAIFEHNSKDGGNRKFVMIQLPELVQKNQAAYKDGYKTIADIGKERIRRAARKIKEEQSGQLALNGNKNPDLGFKVFKLASSNFRIWEGDVEKIDNLEKQLEMHIDHVDDTSTPEDILYELLLKAGFSLTTKVEKLTMANKDVFSIKEGAMLICLDKELNQAVIDAMAGANPQQVICLDEGFKGNDQLKTNAVKTFETLSGDEESEIQFKTV